MASIIRDTFIETDPESAWDALSDFGALHERLAAGFVTGTEMQGPDTRLITFSNGAVARERLVGIDADARRLSYSVIESGLNAAHHNASAQIIDDGDGRTRFVWITDVLPDELATPIGEMMDHGIAAIKQTLELRSVSAP
jgi:hypothetical protein